MNKLFWLQAFTFFPKKFVILTWAVINVNFASDSKRGEVHPLQLFLWRSCFCSIFSFRKLSLFWDCYSFLYSDNPQHLPGPPLLPTFQIPLMLFAPDLRFSRVWNTSHFKAFSSRLLAVTPALSLHISYPFFQHSIDMFTNSQFWSKLLEVFFQFTELVSYSSQSWIKLTLIIQG